MPDTSYEGAMRRALALAEQGRWNACPNPTVGAVLLRDGHIVAEGYHRAAGEPHAEIECLADARAKGIDPRGATMAVTLEPCNHHGKTPPCSEALIEAGIARVVFGLRDPNPLAAGGLERLRQAGIDVTGPVLEQECRDLIADFLVWQTEQRPYVILKLASTLDGRISTRNRQRQQISNAASHHNVHLLRAGIGHCGGAVLIGGGTFRADNPALTARTVPTDRQPLACILTSRLPQPTADFQLLRDRPQDTIFFVSPAACASTVAHALGEKGVRVFSVGPGINGRPTFPPSSNCCGRIWAAPTFCAKAAANWGHRCLNPALWTSFSCISRRESWATTKPPPCCRDAARRPWMRPSVFALQMSACATAMCI